MSLQDELHYNNPRYGNDRVAVKSLTTEESAKAVALLSEALHFHEDSERRLIQRLIWRYENLEHFEATHSGND